MLIGSRLILLRLVPLRGNSPEHAVKHGPLTLPLSFKLCLAGFIVGDEFTRRGIPFFEIADMFPRFLLLLLFFGGQGAGDAEFGKGDADFEVFDTGGEVFLLAVSLDVDAVGVLLLVEALQLFLVIVVFLACVSAKGRDDGVRVEGRVLGCGG